MHQMIPEVKSCCCGCTLRRGSLIIAYISLVGCALIFIMAIRDLGMISELDCKELGKTYIYNNMSIEEPCIYVRNIGYPLALFEMIWSIVYALLVIVLIFGIKKNLPLIMKPYIYFSFAANILYIFIVIFLSSSYSIEIFYLKLYGPHEIIDIALFIGYLVGLVKMAVMYYCIAVVNSLYLQMEKESEPTTIHIPQTRMRVINAVIPEDPNEKDPKKPGAKRP